MISFFAGLPHGTEGPAVLLGTSIGGMCSNLSKNKGAWGRYIMSGGAGAGFAVTTGAPLSAILFVFEEIHKKLAPMQLLIVSFSVISASCVNRFLCFAFDMESALISVDVLPQFELVHIGYLLILGVVIAVAAAAFDFISRFFSKFTHKICKIPQTAKMVFLFLLAGILCLFLADGAYSGHDIIIDVLHNNKSLFFLVSLFAIRFVMLILTADAGSTGGIFIPSLAVGALASAITAKLLISLGLPEELFPAFVILGMCAFVGGTMRAPLTATVFFIEATGQFSNLIFIALVIFTVTAITELLNQKPFYDRTLEETEDMLNRGKELKNQTFKLKISADSFAAGKTVKNILWPNRSSIVGIIKAENDFYETDNNGEKKLNADDTVIIKADFFDEHILKEQLRSLAGSEPETINLKGQIE